MNTDIIRQQIARGIVLKSLAVTFPQDLSGSALKMAVEAHGIYLEDDFPDVLFFLQQRGYVVGVMERETVRRARLHATGLDLVQGVIQDKSVQLEPSMHYEVPAKRGRLLQILRHAYPRPTSLAVLFSALLRWHPEPTQDPVARELAYLIDKGLVDEELLRVPGMGAALGDGTVMYRLSAEGVAFLEEGEDQPWIALPTGR